MVREKSAPSQASRLKKRRRNDINLNRKILNLQNSDIPMLPKLPFSRLVREIMQQYKENYRITAEAMVINKQKKINFAQSLRSISIVRISWIFTDCALHQIGCSQALSAQRKTFPKLKFFFLFSGCTTGVCRILSHISI